MATEPFETAESEEFRTVTQLSVFIDDRVGQLLRLTQLFDKTEIRILGLSVVNSVDCAIVRMIVDDATEAYRILVDHRFPVKESEVLVVCLPHGKRALINLWTAILSAEINVHYTYALLGMARGGPMIALHAENLETTCEALQKRRFVVLSASDLREGREF